jgi:putative serine protease PepD
MPASPSRRGLAVSALAGVLAAVVVTLAVGAMRGGSSRTVIANEGGSALSLPLSNAAKPTSATQIYRVAAPSVVAIAAGATPIAFNGGGGGGGASGTGFVIDPSGLILTNNHVIDGAGSITVSFNGSNGPTRTASVVATDPTKDLALLKIDPGGMRLHALRIADTGGLQVGDPVYAIGNPFGLDETLTVGIVSALDRTIQAPDGASIHGAIQTDAALNPGNSGGPLLDGSGRVIGVNSQIATGSEGSGFGGGGANTGVGFAVSGSTIRSVLPALEKGGTIGPNPTPAVQGFGPPGGFGYGYRFRGGGIP